MCRTDEYLDKLNLPPRKMEVTQRIQKWKGAKQRRAALMTSLLSSYVQRLSTDRYNDTRFCLNRSRRVEGNS